MSLGSAETIIDGPGAGDEFGAATAAGNVIDLPSEARRSVIVGAPGAAGGRGAVYLFRGGFTSGQHLTPADAALTITGAAGDRLGTTVATADLDNDGFREIIMGAPGTGRVYILYGGRGLPAAPTPDVTITASGLGRVMAAGDITDDGVYDLLLSVPSQSLVYMVKGRASGSRLPASMQFSRDEDAYFYGVGADEAGSSLSIGDVNGDGKSDLLIGAPGGGTAEAGAVYVLLGNAGRVVTNLAQADLTVLGPSPSARMGRFVTSGDMNRDGRDDIAMLTSTGPGSVGEVLVYYGRSGALAPAGPNGFPTADLSVTSNISRRIVGDAAGGGITACVIFEVTGEGARDVIVGAPTANTDAGTASGRVYFSNSPRLSIPTSAYLAAVQGGTGSTTIAVRNESTVPITWSARAGATWQSLGPTAGSAVANQPGTFTVTGSAAGLAPATYVQNVTVTSTSRDLEMFRTVPVTMAVFTPPTLTADRTFPAPAGSPITWTADTNAGTLPLQYQFWRYDPGFGWRLGQSYSASKTYTWTPGVDDAGDHYVQVWVRSTSSSATYDVYASAPTASIVTPVPAVDALESDTQFPAALGSSIRWTARGSGGIAPVQYQFWVYKEGTGWSQLQAYGTSNTAVWTPSSTGRYAVQVWARNAGSQQTYQAWAGSPMLDISTTAPLTVQSLTPDVPMPAKVGTPVTWTALASGGSAGPLQYQFWRYNQGTGLWTMAQAYGSSRTYTWTPAAGEEGTYSLQVWVRSAGSSATYQGWAGTPMFAVQRDPVRVTALQASATSPVAAGSTVTWTASAQGGANLRYKFYVYEASTGWTLLRDYAAGNTAQWTPTMGGSYQVQVWVRSADSTAAYDGWMGTPAPVMVQAPN